MIETIIVELVDGTVDTYCFPLKQKGDETIAWTDKGTVVVYSVPNDKKEWTSYPLSFVKKIRYNREP